MNDSETVWCPCGGRVVASMDMGPTVGGAPGVLHSMPPCKDFEQRDPTEFLIWLNDQLGTRILNQVSAMLEPK